MDLLGELQRAEFKEAFDEFDKVCTIAFLTYIFLVIFQKFRMVVERYLPKNCFKLWGP